MLQMIAATSYKASTTATLRPLLFLSRGTKVY